jgi:hypothetical protein
LPAFTWHARLFKKGQGFRRDFPEQKLFKLVSWFSHHFEIGMHGDPCGSGPDHLEIRRRHICDEPKIVQ